MRLFLAYPDELRALAEQLSHRLEAEGHSVFFDRHDLPPASRFDERIRVAISQSDALVFLIAPTSVAAGSYPRTELSFAQQKWRNPSDRVLPVMAVSTPIEDLPPYLRSVSVLTPHGDPVAEVLAAVAGMARRRSPFAKRWLQVSVVLLVTLMGVVAWRTWMKGRIQTTDWNLQLSRSGLASLPDEYALNGTVQNRASKPVSVDRITLEVSDKDARLEHTVAEPPFVLTPSGSRPVHIRVTLHAPSRGVGADDLREMRWRPCWTSNGKADCGAWGSWPARAIPPIQAPLSAELRARARAVAAWDHGFIVALAGPNELVALDDEGLPRRPPIPLAGEPTAVTGGFGLIAVGTSAPGTVQLFDAMTLTQRMAVNVPEGRVSGSAASTAVASLALTADALWVVTEDGGDGDAAIRRLLIEGASWTRLPYGDNVFAFDARGIRLRAGHGQLWGVTTATIPSSLYRLTTRDVQEYKGHDFASLSCTHDVTVRAASQLFVRGCRGEGFALTMTAGSVSVVRRIAAPFAPVEEAWEHEWFEEIPRPSMASDASGGVLVGVSVMRDDPTPRHRVPARSRITRFTEAGTAHILFDAPEVVISSMGVGPRFALVVVHDRHGVYDVVRLALAGPVLTANRP